MRKRGYSAREVGPVAAFAQFQQPVVAQPVFDVGAGPARVEGVELVLLRFGQAVAQLPVVHPLRQRVAGGLAWRCCGQRCGPSCAAPRARPAPRGRRRRRWPALGGAAAPGKGSQARLRQLRPSSGREGAVARRCRRGRGCGWARNPRTVDNSRAVRARHACMAPNLAQAPMARAPWPRSPLGRPGAVARGGRGRSAGRGGRLSPRRDRAASAACSARRAQGAISAGESMRLGGRGVPVAHRHRFAGAGAS
jgi:hypothetical protein